MMRWAAVVVTVGFVLGGLVGPRTPATVEGAPAGQRLIVAQPFDAESLDPGVQTDETSMGIYVNTFDSLYERNQEMIPKPRLATSAKMLDPLTWEVKLRSGVKFQNGEPFNADAVKFSIERVFDPRLKSVLPTWLNGITTVDVVDPLTVRIHTKTAMSLMLENLCLIYPVPPQYVTKVGNVEFNQKPIGTGPYLLKEWARGDHVTLEANKNYWAGKPAYSELVIRFIPDDVSRVSALVAGELDIAVNVPPALQNQVRQANGIDLRRVDSGRLWLLQLAVTPQNKPLQDDRVRQAIAHAIDQSALIKFVALGAGYPLNTIVNPRNFGYDPTIKPYPYDPAAAQRLLSDAGYPHGFPFLITTQAIGETLAQAVAGQLQRVGIDAQAQVYESGAWIAGWRGHTLPGQAMLVGLLSQTWDADGMLYLRLACGEPMAYYCSTDTDNLVRQGRDAMASAQRERIYTRLLELLQQRMPLVPLYGVVRLYGAKASINWTPRADDLTFYFEAKPR